MQFGWQHERVMFQNASVDEEGKDQQRNNP